jgi:hypothetical protein
MKYITFVAIILSILASICLGIQGKWEAMVWSLIATIWELIVFLREVKDVQT